jgi:multisubunit Na+/H+ antiporter MnhE subunit
VRRLAAAAVTWLALFWLWLLLVGEWNRVDLVAAAVAATIAATAAEVARRRAGVDATVSPRLLWRSRTVPLDVVVDFWVLVRALVDSLVHRRVVRGSLHVPQTDTTDPAWLTWLGGISPNAYVIDVDPEAGTALVHDLVTRRKSEQPV